MLTNKHFEGNLKSAVKIHVHGCSLRLSKRNFQRDKRARRGFAVRLIKSRSIVVSKIVSRIWFLLPNASPDTKMLFPKLTLRGISIKKSNYDTYDFRV